MVTHPISLGAVLQHMDALNGQLQQLEAEKQQKLKEDLQRKQLLHALDDPQTRVALRSQLELARNQIDALALQLDTQRQMVTTAHAQVQKALDKLDKSPSLSATLASRLSDATAKASQSFRSVGLSGAFATPTAEPATASAPTVGRKGGRGAKPNR